MCVCVRRESAYGVCQTPSTGLRHPSLEEGARKRCSECVCVCVHAHACVCAWVDACVCVRGGERGGGGGGELLRHGD